MHKSHSLQQPFHLECGRKTSRNKLNYLRAFKLINQPTEELPEISVTADSRAKYIRPNSKVVSVRLRSLLQARVRKCSVDRESRLFNRRYRCSLSIKTIDFQLNMVCKIIFKRNCYSREFTKEMSRAVARILSQISSIVERLKLPSQYLSGMTQGHTRLESEMRFMDVMIYNDLYQKPDGFLPSLLLDYYMHLPGIYYKANCILGQAMLDSHAIVTGYKCSSSRSVTILIPAFICSFFPFIFFLKIRYLSSLIFISSFKHKLITGEIVFLSDLG